MEDRLNKIENELELIKQRNLRVENEKSWETSIARRLSIIVLTYAVMVLFMNSIKVSDPFVSALVPTLGFFLSTLSLPFIKNLWIKSRKDS